jgi:hypothetical protein
LLATIVWSYRPFVSVSDARLLGSEFLGFRILLSRIWDTRRCYVLVGDGPERHTKQIRLWSNDHPSIALIVAAVYFEWTICRIVIGLSLQPNTVIRQELEKVYGLPKLIGYWISKLRHVPDYQALNSIINFRAVEGAFKARNKLAHGKDRYTRNMAQPHIDALLQAVAAVRDFGLKRGSDPVAKLRIRRRVRTAL